MVTDLEEAGQLLDTRPDLLSGPELLEIRSRIYYCSQNPGSPQETVVRDDLEVWLLQHLRTLL